jgi:hypothetical protein
MLANIYMLIGGEIEKLGIHLAAMMIGLRAAGRRCGGKLGPLFGSGAAAYHRDEQLLTPIYYHLEGLSKF